MMGRAKMALQHRGESFGVLRWYLDRSSEVRVEISYASASVAGTGVLTLLLSLMVEADGERRGAEGVWRRRVGREAGAGGGPESNYQTVATRS
jgi:hypothetical protein